MANNNSRITVGPSGATLLTIVFVLLKVFGYINWSWWWVFAPIWISAILVIGILLFILTVVVLAEIWE